eukprot:scaffold23234_cov67-Cyclotella_meneghiniana.AAC.1
MLSTIDNRSSTLDQRLSTPITTLHNSYLISEGHIYGIPVEIKVDKHKEAVYICCWLDYHAARNHDVAVRLVASSHILSCRPAAYLWKSGIVNKQIISVFIGQSNFDTKGSYRLYRNQSRLPLDDCETVEDVLQLAFEQRENFLHLAVEQRQNLHPNQNAALWTYIFRLISKGQKQKVVSKDDVAQLELLISDILEVTLDSLPRMRSKDLTTIILQLAKIAKRVSSKHYKRLSASELAFKNILFDKEPNVQPSIFDPLAEAANQNLVNFEPRELSNIAYAYSLLGYNPRIDDNTTLLENIADVSLDCIQQFNAQNISNMMWAYTKLHVSHGPLFHSVGDAIVMKDYLTKFKPQAIANVVWAFAATNVQHPALFKKVANEIVAMDDWKSFNSQALSNIAWAYTVSNIDTAPLFSSAFRQELLDRQNNFIDQNLRQLYQWHLWQTKEKSDYGLPDFLCEQCKQTFSSSDTTSSALQKDVVAELKSIGLNPVEEYLTESGYSIDALVEINGTKVGIEVDGPSHFIGRKPNGRTLLKRRQVESIDKISLVSVPYWEWGKLGKDRDKKQKYLQPLLKMTA